MQLQNEMVTKCIIITFVYTKKFPPISIYLYHLCELGSIEFTLLRYDSGEWDCLTFIMETPILESLHLYNEMDSRDNYNS